MSSRRRLLFIIHYSLFILLLLGCQSTIVYSKNAQKTPATTQQLPTTESRTPHSELHTPNSTYMVASWYGSQFHGRKTANGETFDMYDMTAAHRTLPFGTRLKLINEENGKEAVVRINDRGPVPTERDIDVSYKTAEVLGFVNAGICRLKVIYLD